MNFRFAAVFAALFSLSAAAAIPEPPTLDATSYMLYDFDSGEVLVSSNPDIKVGPASITKVMLAYVVFDEIKKAASSSKMKPPSAKKPGSRALIPPSHACFSTWARR